MHAMLISIWHDLAQDSPGDSDDGSYAAQRLHAFASRWSANQAGTTKAGLPPSSLCLPSCRANKRRLASQFEDLQRHYMQLRRGQSSSQDLQLDSPALAPPVAGTVPPPAKRQHLDASPATSAFAPAAALAVPSNMQRAVVGSDREAGSAMMQRRELQHLSGTVARLGAIDTALQEFAGMLSMLTKCSRLKVCANTAFDMSSTWNLPGLEMLEGSPTSEFFCQSSSWVSSNGGSALLLQRCSHSAPCVQVITHISQTGTRQSTSILSSIDFDRDAHHFATAGVSKRISIYE